MSDEPFATGGCVCGAVHYTIDNPPMLMAHCHCSDCRKSSGGGHMSLAFFKEDDVHITGEATGYHTTADSGNVNTRFFCPTCGGRVFSRNSGRPGMIGIPVGGADNSDWFKPAAVVYTSGRPSWDSTPEDIPNFEKMPPPPK
jgi:hypothetical protein